VSTPILKWAGGKGRLVPLILSLAPLNFVTYHEPFMGAGAVFFGFCRANRIRSARLNDLNSDLIEMYRALRDNPQAVVRKLNDLAHEYLSRPHEQRAEVYYRVRSEKPSDPTDRAAWLIFLNRTCYNGLYRVNRRGGFNVPHGDYANPRIVNLEGLQAASLCLQETELSSVDFQVACENAVAGDFVYLDPPYQPLSPTANFTSYTSEAFGAVEQVRLREEFENLTRRGVAAVLSNSSHPFILELYSGSGYTISEVLMPRAISSAADGRAPIPELVVSNRERSEVFQAFSSSPK
jgi:DNA adenine methylase